MKTMIRLFLFAACAIGLTAQAHAAGNVFVFNEAAVNIHPYFKCPGSSTWSDFGTVGAGGFFGWGPGIGPCGLGDYSFTYTIDGQPAPTDPVKGVLKTIFTLDANSNIVIQVGANLRALQVQGPGENGR